MHKKILILCHQKKKKKHTIWHLVFGYRYPFQDGKKNVTALSEITVNVINKGSWTANKGLLSIWGCSNGKNFL
jgi:hypothetical protein